MDNFLMKWQDLVFMIGGFIFSLALIPTIRAKEKPAISSSLMTLVVLTAYGVSYLTLDLYLASITTILTAGAWLILLIQKMRGKR